jgi:Fur family ferric uptake transcriptional regulator
MDYENELQFHLRGVLMNKQTDTLKNFIKHRTKYGLKSSDKRTYVVDFFMRAGRHFTVEELYNEVKKRKSGISYSTVYRALKLLTQWGLAGESMFGNSVSKYEPIDKAGHHDHLICKECGKIIEFENGKIEKLQYDVAQKYGFNVSAHRLELYGVCRECRKKRRRR